jgi:pimeloyl-ACP methyl ester carboxylesterase
MDDYGYDEFGFLADNAAEAGLPFDRSPTVRRESFDIGDGRALSALVWGDSPADLVLLHGGAQNAHTWDTVALALDRPLLAVDLPGHGHSDGPIASSTANNPRTNADDVAQAMRAASVAPAAVVGMSLGGLTTIALADSAPELVRKVVLVDVLPGMTPARARHISDFVNGPPTFSSFDELLQRTMHANPTRTESSLRRGILHNAVQLPDGTWQWRWARHTQPPLEVRQHHASPSGLIYEDLWEPLTRIRVPLLLIRGMRPDSVLRDDDEARFRERVPHAQVIHVAEAGHSVQGDAPVELARIITEFALGDPR